LRYDDAMPSNTDAAAAALIHRTWQDGTTFDALPPALRPATRAAGYAIQAALAAFSAAPLYGWKIAATSLAGQRHIAVAGPLAGRIFAERVIAEGEAVPFGVNHMRVAEVEFAFRMAGDLPPRAAPYTAAEVIAAVATLHPAIEIPDSRFTDFTQAGEAQLIADLACGHYFVAGAATTADWRGLDLAAHRVIATRNGGPPVEGFGANVLGDPRVALAWLANELSGLGIPLRAGETITTGTCLIPIPIAPHDVIAADFGVLGQITVRFGS
jgi:2-keto-4-pentenoate hydratase